MAEGDAGQVPTCHVLNFFYDDEDSCALTVLINGVRFHIIVDASRLQDPGSDEVFTKYLKRLRSVKVAGANIDSVATKGEITKGVITEDEAIHKGGDATPKSDQSSPVRDDKDSAIDVSADNKYEKLKGAGDEESQADSEVELRLQNWILGAFDAETRRLAPGDSSSKKQSLHEWYHGETHYFEVHFIDDRLVPQELEEIEELRVRMEELTPRLPMPKYIQEMDLLWISPKDIEVLSEIVDPEPVHPGTVKYNDEVYFFKPVDPDQSQPTKREIKILQKIEMLGLGDKIMVPRLLGVVTFEQSTTEVMGLLLTNIPSPKPLTTLLRSDIPEAKRLRWADEAQNVIKELHQNGIVWGDAKADNFMVDKNDNLWIIDFGGSYTEGWVDPEVSETKAGDKMGIEKIIDALVDPDENTFDPEDDAEDDSDFEPAPKKRKREDGSEDRRSPRKQTRSD
ncbi:hypothetical protein RBB50_012779 [Rhinocladiella similis]